MNIQVFPPRLEFFLAPAVGGVGHVVKARVIGSACPGLGSNSVRHAAFATNKTVEADRNICMLSSSCGKVRSDFSCACLRCNEKTSNLHHRWH